MFLPIKTQESFIFSNKRQIVNEWRQNALQLNMCTVLKHIIPSRHKDMFVFSRKYLGNSCSICSIKPPLTE